MRERTVALLRTTLSVGVEHETSPWAFREGHKMYLRVKTVIE